MPEAPHIVHTVAGLRIDGGGPPRSVSQLCAGLVESGCRVAIVTAQRPAEQLIELHPGINLYTVQAPPPGRLSRLRVPDFAIPLQRIAQEEPIDVIHTHGIWLRSCHQATRFAVHNKLPLLLAPRGMLAQWALSYRAWKKRLAWHLYQLKDLNHVDVFHATAAIEADSIRANGLRQPIALLPNGVNPIAPEPLAPSAASAPKEKKIALFLGRLHPVKGLPLLLEAWANLQPEEWELHLAGNDEVGFQAELEAYIDKRSVRQSVRFLGPLYGAEKDTAFRRADLFVLPSHTENFGVAIAEALQYGVPVITTTGTPWSELQTERCGWWVEVTTKAIQQALEEAFALDDATRREMGARGADLIQRKYLWTSIAQSTLEVYQWLRGEGERPGCMYEA